MDEAGADLLWVLKVLGGKKLRNSELLICKQHELLAHAQLWVLPPSCVLTAAGQVGEGSWASPAAVRMFLGRHFFEECGRGPAWGQISLQRSFYSCSPLHLVAMKMM